MNSVLNREVSAHVDGLLVGRADTPFTADHSCRDSLLFKVVRQDEGFELEVTDPKDEE